MASANTEKSHLRYSASEETFADLDALVQGKLLGSASSPAQRARFELYLASQLVDQTQYFAMTAQQRAHHHEADQQLVNSLQSTLARDSQYGPISPQRCGTRLLVCYYRY